MKQLTIKGATGNSEIFINERLENLSAYLPDTRVIIITDTNVSNLYADRFPDTEIITIGTGEVIKTMDTAANIYRRLIELQADRSSFLVGIGGGIVCDITGFAASTYMRGIGFGYVATTLLAQVDASVGGKTGVNFMGYKNMVGVFNQPDFVLCDPNVLQTLSTRDLACGFGEIIKHAAITDADYFSYLEAHSADAGALNAPVMEKIIFDSVRIKADVVNRDEKEAGERRKLNFGHTLGHAVEKTTKLPHGEAVAVGMIAAARLSAEQGLISKADVERLRRLVLSYGLPVSAGIDKKAIMDAMARDKKRKGAGIHFVLLAAIGQAVIEEISMDELEAVVDLL
ncbi:MAG: 3-dehydroquinate synthase [Deltaproteobacteria bacterium]|nr:3-dehydroquinate synthase [Deltaproteobacteria bacterium]